MKRGDGARKDRSETRSKARVDQPHSAPSQARAFVVGDYPARVQQGIARAAARASVKVTFASSTTAALARMGSGEDRPVGLFVSAEGNPQQSVEQVRDDPRFFALPVVALVTRATGAEYQRAAFAGADDVQVVGDDGGITRRLANLSAFEPGLRPSATLGRVAVASSDVEIRKKLGRPLRQAGFDVDYVTTLPELAAQARGAQHDPLMFAVATFGDPSEGGEHRGPDQLPGGPPVLWFAEADLSGSLVQLGDQLTNATSRMLFFADEQRTAAFREGRKSERRLHPAICAFRIPGTFEPVFGLTHNISAEGMYVRTMDPPPGDTILWVELFAPVTREPVHLRARIVWRRLPGAGQGVLPPGFGMQLISEECTKRDLERYLAGYRELG